MSYSEDLSRIVADQLHRFVTLNRHQLAGHLNNLDFWIGEARHALQVIDGYEKRYQQLKSGQRDHVKRHNTIVSPSDDPDISSMPPPPRPVPTAELQAARRHLVDGIYKFLLRLHDSSLIDEQTLRARCADLGIGIDAQDLRRPE